METTGKKQAIAEKVFNGLNEAITEIDELRVKAALGRAEARDAFEQIKKKFNETLHASRLAMHNLLSGPELLHVTNAFEFLQVQLSLGMAETRDAFAEQERRIRQALDRLEVKIRSSVKPGELTDHLRIELNKFRIKLELLALHYKLDMLKMEFKFQDKRQELKLQMEKLRENILHGEGREKLSHFGNEIKEAFSHIRAAFTSPVQE